MSDAFTAKLQCVQLQQQSPLTRCLHKNIPFQVEKLTPGLHVWKLNPVTGCLRTLPVLLPPVNLNRRAIADSTKIWHSIESRFLSPPLLPADERKAS
ncbi:hypothetical protein QUA82_34715 [Microcoleus sp. F8-D3]